MAFRNPDAPVIPPQGYTFNPYTGCYEPVQDLRMGYPQRNISPPVPSLQNQTNQNPYAVKGRWIKSPEEVLPRDIPDDGTVALFPLSDFSAVIAKAWKSDGTIEVVRYIPEKNIEPEKPDMNQRILGELEENRQTLDQIIEMLTPKKQVRKEQTHEPGTEKAG